MNHAESTAWGLAAVLAQHGVKTLRTHDKDFRKFTFLDLRDPVA